jgi:hypothetical protein
MQFRLESLNCIGCASGFNECQKGPPGETEWLRMWQHTGDNRLHVISYDGGR